MHFAYRSILLISFLSILTFCQSKEGEPEYNLRFGHIVNEEDTWHKAAIKFKEEVEEKSKGRIRVKIYPNEQLGKEMDMVTGILSGSVDLLITAESLENWGLPLSILCATPYAIRDSEHLRKVAGGTIGKEIEKHIEEVSGLIPIAWFERGARNLTSNIPITHPNDLKNLIIRVPNVSLFVEIWSALGAKPTPMAFSEIFTALQQSTIHGQENPFSHIRNAGLYEVQKFVNLTEHVRGWAYVVMGKKQFENLPIELQAVVMDAAEIMQAYEHNLFLEQEKLDKEYLKAKGMQFVEVDKEAFQRTAREAVESNFNKEQKAMYKRIQAIE